MIGVGLISMDIALFMSTIAAGLVNLYYLPMCWRYSKGVAGMRMLRLAGWIVLSTRFGAVLFTTGDILISPPAAIGVFFLAAGEIAALFNRGKKVPL